ncbi:hypothetical protein DBR42_23775, partial [Pelomonas sp. HMWF004]
MHDAAPLTAPLQDSQHPQPPQRAVTTAYVPRVETVAAFGLHVSRQLAQVRRQGGQLAVLWVDVTEPASEPAELVRALSRRLRNRVRNRDEVVQVGDGSFAVLLTLAGAAEADLVQERLRTALRGNYDLDGTLMRADVRLGCATFPEAGRHGAELAESARQNCAASHTPTGLPLAQTSSHSLR